MKPLKMADILFHGESQAEKRPPKKRKRERKKLANGHLGREAMQMQMEHKCTQEQSWPSEIQYTVDCQR